MKPALLSAIVAAIVSALVVMAGGGFGSGPGTDAAPEAPRAATTAAPVFSFTDALPEDVWVNASRQAGSDERTLTSTATSVCYITKIEISGIQSPDDTSSCAVEIDDFTGFWQLIATADEGSRSEIRCNARCLSWESGGAGE